MGEHKRPEIYLRGGLQPYGWFGTRTLRPCEALEATLVPVEEPSRTQRRLTRAFPDATPFTMSLSDNGSVCFRNGKRVVKVAAKSLGNVRITTEFPIEMVEPLHPVSSDPLPTMRRVIVADITRGGR